MIKWQEGKIRKWPNSLIFTHSLKKDDDYATFDSPPEEDGIYLVDNEVILVMPYKKNVTSYYRIVRAYGGTRKHLIKKGAKAIFILNRLAFMFQTAGIYHEEEK